MNHGEWCHKANDETLISKEENGFPTMGRASLPRGRSMACLTMGLSHDMGQATSRLVSLFAYHLRLKLSSFAKPTPHVFDLCFMCKGPLARDYPKL